MQRIEYTKLDLKLKDTIASTRKSEEVQVDHIIPLQTAKTTDEVIKLCHYTNLQLLRKEDNLKKAHYLLEA